VGADLLGKVGWQTGALDAEPDDSPVLGQLLGRDGGGDAASTSQDRPAPPATWARQPSAFGSTTQSSNVPVGRPLEASIGGVHDNTASKDAAQPAM